MIISNEILVSKQNPTVKWAASLLEKKGRRESTSFVVEGIKLSLEAAATCLPVSHIFVLASKSGELLPRLSSAYSDSKYNDTRVIAVSDEVFSKISTEKAPEGVVTVIKYLDFFSELDIIYKEDFFLDAGERALALFSVRDPGNLGAVIRSAVAFGIDHIVLSRDCADVYNPKTVRSAMGGLFRVKTTVVDNFPSFITAAKDSGRQVYAAELRDGAMPLDKLELSSTDVFVIGNEGHGISEEISSLCTASVYIPISVKTESLNAAVAASILMWEQSKA